SATSSANEPSASQRNPDDPRPSHPRAPDHHEPEPEVHGFRGTSGSSCPGGPGRPGLPGRPEAPPRHGGGPMPTPMPPAGRDLLAGKVVLVTAAAGTGIGNATARRCLEEGATVVLSDAHERRLGEAADELTELAGHTRPATFVCDVTVEEQVQAMVDGTVAAHGRLDVLVNNAGLGGTAPLVEMTDDEWHRVLDVTLTGTMRVTRAALRHLV